MYYRTFVYSFLFLLLFSFPSNAKKLNVVVSFSILEDLATNVGKNRVSVTSLIKRSMDPHIYEPKPDDALALKNADLILINGLHFEGFIERLVQTSATKAKVIYLTKGIESLPVHNGKEEHDHDEQDHHHDQHEKNHHHHKHTVDPHAFQSVENVKIYVKNIANAFCKKDPQGCKDYKNNAASYTASLDSLNKQIISILSSIPADRRVVVTSHDAFGYFEKAYGIRFLSVKGISSESEATAADFSRIIRAIREGKAFAVFIENLSDPRMASFLAKETGLKLGGTLYADSLSSLDGPAPTYSAMMLHNSMTIKNAIMKKE